MAPPRVLSLLGFLIVNRDRRLTRAAVASALWPDELEEDARANLRRHLYRLNSELPKIDGEPAILASTATVQWNPAIAAWIDVAEFERLARAPETAAAATDLYAGEFLAGAFDDWAVAERERLLSIFLDLALELALRARANRDFVATCDYADRILTLGEWREDALRVKMAALYEMGDRPGALAAFDAFSNQLRDDMGVDVMPETRALRESIVANVPLSSDTADARSAQAALPIFGRGEELDRLLGMWQVAARRAGTTVFIGGEAGVGKTRLLAEVARSVELQGGHALFGHVREGEGAPYQPFIDVLRAAAPYLVRDEVPDVWLSALAPLVPELLRLHPDLPEIPSIEAGRQRLHEAFARVLESLARRRPIAVLLEDLHWSNVDTLDALAHLARRAGSSHVLIVATYRPEQASSEHPLRTLRRHLQQERRATVIGLGPLDRAAIGTLVAEAAPGARDPVDLADAIYRSSEGNPLFAWQLLQSYVETGTLSNERAIDQAIAARASRLPEQTRRVLEVASLVGDRFSVEELAEIGAWNERDVFAAVDALLDARLFRYSTAPGLDLSFAHRLIRDAVAAGIPQEGRPGVHRRIATVLRRTRDADLELIAGHFAMAGDREAAYAAYMRAAHAALAIYANGDAALRAARAAELAGSDRERYNALLLELEAYRFGALDQEWESAFDEAETVAALVGDDERFEVLRRRCRFFEILSRRDEQQAAARRLLELSEASGRAQHRMHALYELGRFAMITGRLKDGVAWLSDALDTASPEDRKFMLRCRTLLSFAHARIGDPDAGKRMLEQAYALLDDDNDLDTRSELLTADMGMALVLEDEAAYRRVGETYLTMSTQVGSVTGEGLALTALGQSAYMRGDVAEARRRYKEAVDLFERHGPLQNLMTNLNNNGWMEREVGNFEAALANWDRVLPLARRLDSKSTLACCVINIGEALLAQGDAARALPHLEEGVAVSREIGETRLSCDATVALGCARARLGAIDEGIALMREAISMRASIRAHRSLANDYCMLIETLLDAGREEQAAEAAVHLRALYEAAPQAQMFPTFILATLARAANASGSGADAKRFLAQGRLLFERRMAELPDDATRASYAALAFNRAYGSPAAV